MTGVGETLLPLNLPKMPCVMVNPCVPVATKDVFKALGLRNGELLVGATDVLCRTGLARSRARRSKIGSRRLPPVPTIWKRRRMRIQPVIGEVHRGAQRDQRRLAGADVGLGRDLLCDLREHRRGRPRRGEDPARSSRLVGACGDAELGRCRRCCRVGKAKRAHHHDASTMDGGHGACAFAHPHMRALESSIRPGLGCNFLHSEERRRAEPCVAQRAAAVGALRDWLPAIYAAAHCITSYPVGPLIRTHIPHACGEEATRMRPIYETACLLAQGWHGHHPSRADRGRCRDAGAFVKWLRLHGLEHRALGHEAGGEIAPERHDQLARQGDDGDALDALAGIGVRRRYSWVSALSG